MKCPVCDKENLSMLCPQCSFDSSRDYGRYPTFGAVGRVPSVSALQEQWQEKSQLKNGTMRYLMVVNRDIYQPQRVTVECAEEVMRYLPTGKVVAASTYSPSLYVEPGDMLLFGWQETK